MTSRLTSLPRRDLTDRRRARQDCASHLPSSVVLAAGETFMGQDIPPAPPEAEVIRLAREATGMTAQSAAEASKAQDPAGRGISAAYWRDVERGHGGRRGE